MSDEKQEELDFVTRDGRGVIFDLDQITVGEWRAEVDGKLTVAQEDELACRVSGLSLEEYTGMSLNDQKRFWRAFIVRKASPLRNVDDPKN
jgi:hypothetical protein